MGTNLLLDRNVAGEFGDTVQFAENLLQVNEFRAQKEFGKL
ncbi:MAG TPA: hypothetical protein VK789_21655 [Bryobacteraceae bacterium]|nr:hypothetical protein [Bryobacteraceae bacterium]